MQWLLVQRSDGEYRVCSADVTDTDDWDGISSCGFTTCHGLDLACGANPPHVCTMEYALGDKCRQYAYCSGAGGSCRLVTTTAYDKCKACVQKWGGANTTGIFICDEKC
jgi:hypothetical protein